MSTKIQSVDAGSPVERAGVHAGETLLEINGHRVVDVLDYKFYGYDPRLTLTLRAENRTTRTVRLRKREGEDMGLNFETYLMDCARSCANKCIFCFVDQLPKGMRDTLYFKDDDARLSFLMGNYITLTNLSDREAQRIIDLHISPINVSVHATDPALRSMLLGFPNGGRGLELMRRFAENGITMNCQIVSCPGINDGPALRKSMEDLVGMYPGVNSVSIVPVGLTRHRGGLYPLEPYQADTAAAVVDMVEAYGADCKERFGTTVFWCSDEFYLKAEREIPEPECYEDFQQFENGVGMLSLFKSEFYELLPQITDREKRKRTLSLVTGAAAFGLISEIASEIMKKFPNITINTYCIRNDFFGEMITVSGLLTGTDIINQLKGRELGEYIILPDSLLRNGETVLLDDIYLSDIERELGVKVKIALNSAESLVNRIMNTEE